MPGGFFKIRNAHFQQIRSGCPDRQIIHVVLVNIKHIEIEQVLVLHVDAFPCVLRHFRLEAVKISRNEYIEQIEHNTQATAVSADRLKTELFSQIL